MLWMKWTINLTEFVRTVNKAQEWIKKYLKSVPLFTPLPKKKKLLVVVLEMTIWHMETELKDDEEYARVDVK